MSPFLAFVVSLHVGSQPSASFGLISSSPQDTVGCYFATPALTYSATGGAERGDTAWAVVRLLTGGSAYRPLLLNRGRDRASRWLMAGDTLVLTVFDGLVGWQARMTRTETGWQGSAKYLTDARTTPPYEYRHDLILTRRQCHAPA